MAGASVTEPAASGPRLRRTYSSMWAGEDLDEEYGSVTGGPSKDRRAGGSSKHSSLQLNYAGDVCDHVLYSNGGDDERSWH